ncbi:unnamed protein product [Bursaphelenchus okinawaensis]|uniref:Uncharacterized protein n=1 Tax=Bursaphelenchus okinawaensis TaxID=465554 RepID=A0A811L7J0_9BILA|nr:unnamed protein product [Bursaphelenchus okinawaensis]CAG9118411.1 unnamed protein product [Bursaphelenchus okinawaensis]
MLEDTQWSQLFITSFSVAIGVAFLVAMLVILTVMPDCRSNMPPDMLSVFSIQFAVVLVLLFVNTIALSYTLAVENNVFINNSVTDSPGYLFIFCMTAIATLQLYLSGRRILEYACPKLSQKLPIRSVCFLAMLCAFLLSAKRFINIIFDKRTLNYKIEALRWMYSQPSSEENFYLAAGIGFSLFFLTILYIGAAIMVIHRFATKELVQDEKKELRKDLMWLASCLVMDLLFALLILYSHFVAVPSKYLYLPVASKFYAGWIQSYLLPIWPVFATFIGEDCLRQALRFRTGIFMSGTPPISPSMPRRCLVRNSHQFSSIPIFMKYSLEKRDSEKRDSV